MKIFNSLSGKKEVFTPANPPFVRLYVCGITPYDRAHMGHGRCYTSFDLLYRLLRYLNYTVLYCRNFTDIDDKLLKRAYQELGDENRYKEIADHYIALYHKDMESLNCMTPTYEPYATQVIPEIIALIETLITHKYAYISGSDVYFSVGQFPDYGKLSKKNIDQLIAGARVDINLNKKNPLDFALWKGEPDGSFWKSPWGYGRPGWHIECSAMAEKYLGEQIDIHAGGLDLIFPHHENEIAQTESKTHKPFARYWLHNGFININKQKMSKSLGNFFTLADIFEQYDPMVIRYYFLTHHYRSPLEFSYDDLDSAKSTYERLIHTFSPYSHATTTDKEMRESLLVHEMITHISDDLNTVGALGVLFENIRTLTNSDACAVKKLLHDVCGLSLEPVLSTPIVLSSEIEKLLQEREHARTNREWEKADKLRDQLRACGYKVHDTKI